MATITINENENIKVNLSTQESTLNASLNNINYIPSYKEAEEERRANELVRISNEDERIAYYEDIQQKVANGEFNGEKGDKGEPGIGVPIGGVTGQVLTKNSDDDYDVKWLDAKGGGTADNVEWDDVLNKPDIDNEVYVGTEEPINEDCKIWVNPNGEVSKIPTKTSELINDSNFVSDLSDYAKTEDIPTNISELTNDSNFITTEEMNQAISNAIGIALGGSY